MTATYDDLMRRRMERQPFRYASPQVLLYNLGVGMGRDAEDARELPFVYEGRGGAKAMPTLAATLGSGAADILEGAFPDAATVLHGQQRLRIHRPMPAHADLVGTTWISEAVDKGAGKAAIVTLTGEVQLSTGEPLYTLESVAFIVGGGGFGGPPKSASLSHAHPERTPDIVHVTNTRSDQALLFRLSGDFNPLHADPDVARDAGFARPILHGLCTYGIACRAVLQSVCDYEASAIRSFDTRFTSPVFPGETIHTDIWIEGKLVSFRCRVADRDAVLMDGGRCELA